MTPSPEVSDARDEHRKDLRLNRVISRVLVVGLLVALALMAVGVILTIARPEMPVPHFTSVKDIPAQLAALDPGGFIELGLLVLIATPFARVVALGIAYACRRQWLFAGISFLVMVLLIVGAALGFSLG